MLVMVIYLQKDPLLSPPNDQDLAIFLLDYHPCYPIIFIIIISSYCSYYCSYYGHCYYFYLLNNNNNCYYLVDYNKFIVVLSGVAPETIEISDLGLEEWNCGTVAVGKPMILTR